MDTIVEVRIIIRQKRLFDPGIPVQEEKLIDSIFVDINRCR
jgi:hypothetical protein